MTVISQRRSIARRNAATSDIIIPPGPCLSHPNAQVSWARQGWLVCLSTPPAETPEGGVPQGSGESWKVCLTSRRPFTSFRVTSPLDAIVFSVIEQHFLELKNSAMDLEALTFAPYFSSFI